MINYSPYGFGKRSSEQTFSIAFSGELLDRTTNAYVLGRGYRLYNPHLMRFQSTDSMSPFGRGGINGYAYCNNDPMNWRDPSGHIKTFNNLPLAKGIKNTLGFRARQKYNVTTPGDDTPPITYAAQQRAKHYKEAEMLANSDDRSGSVPRLDELRPSLEAPPGYARAFALLDTGVAKNFVGYTSRSSTRRQPTLSNASRSMREIGALDNAPNPYLTNPEVSNLKPARLAAYGLSPEEIRNRLEFQT